LRVVKLLEKRRLIEVTNLDYRVPKAMKKFIFVQVKILKVIKKEVMKRCILMLSALILQDILR